MAKGLGKGGTHTRFSYAYHAPIWKIKSIFFLSLLNHQDGENGGVMNLSYYAPH